MRVFIIGTMCCLIMAQESPHPDAPEETAQYAFMIGSWDCVIRGMKPDGEFTESKATWKGYYILNGWAIQDDWVSMDSEGNPKFHGTNIRSFNRELDKWECRWLPAGTLKWKHFTSWKDGGTMVMEGEGSDQRGPFIDRNTFHEIGADQWSWRKDRSYDGGKTWIEGVATIKATRIGR